LNHIDDQAKINFQHFKIFLTGSAAAGKSSVRRLLLNKEFKENYKSTEFQKTKHAYALASLLESKESDAIEWFDLSAQQQIKHCKSLLNDLLAKKLIKPKLADEINSISDDDDDDEDDPKVKENILNSKGLPARLKIGDTIKLITIIDTGGQPGYIHLLPVLNCPTSGIVKCPNITFVVHDMTKRLDAPVLVRYKKKDHDEIEPYELPYTNKELIKQLMLITTDLLHSQDNSKSYIGFIGTHKDLLENEYETVSDLNQQLIKIIEDHKCENITIPTNYGCLYPVTNITSGTKNKDDVVKEIRQKIQKIMGCDSHPLPLVWMILELEVKEYCRLKKLPCISLVQYYDIAKNKAAISDEESIKLSPLYFHQLGIFLNFAEVSDYVIVNHQWFFDQLGKVICLENISLPADKKSQSAFQNQGIIPTNELSINMEGDLKLSDLVKLLCNMKVMAKFKRKDIEYYYIPCVLPYWQPREDKYRFLISEPLLVRFQSGYLPRGFFSSLVVNLLQFTVYLINGCFCLNILNSIIEM